MRKQINMSDIYKLYCIFSEESIKAMGGNRGKMVAQGGHAYLHSFWDALDRFHEDAEEYLKWKVDEEGTLVGGAFKIALITPTTQQLLELRDAYQNVCGVSLVQDAGRTVFKEPTITCLGIGPINSSKIGDDIKGLKVFL